MKLTKVKIIEAVEKSQGILTMAAQMLGVSRQTLYTYIDRWKLRPLIDEQKQKLNDKVRYNIVKMINDGNEKVTLWYAERQMFEEFGNKQTVVNENKEPLKIEIGKQTEQGEKNLKMLSDFLKKENPDDTD